MLITGVVNGGAIQRGPTTNGTSGYFLQGDGAGNLSFAAVDTSGFQPLDADLTAIAALTTTAFGRSVLTTADAAALLTLAGGIGGSAGAADNRLVRSDGTGAKTLQATGITVDDSDNTTVPGTVTGSAGVVSGNTAQAALVPSVIAYRGSGYTTPILAARANSASDVWDIFLDGTGRFNVGTNADSPWLAVSSSAASVAGSFVATTTLTGTTQVICGNTAQASLVPAVIAFRGGGYNTPFMAVRANSASDLVKFYSTAASSFQVGDPDTPWLSVSNTAAFVIGSFLVPRVFSTTPQTPSQITSNQNDYAPTSASILRLSTDASRDVTGLSISQVSGSRTEFWNVGAQSIVLKHESASSTAANRFTNSTGADITLAAGEEASLKYDGTTSRWRVRKLA